MTERLELCNLVSRMVETLWPYVEPDQHQDQHQNQGRTWNLFSKVVQIGAKGVRKFNSLINLGEHLFECSEVLALFISSIVRGDPL